MREETQTYEILVKIMNRGSYKHGFFLPSEQLKKELSPDFSGVFKMDTHAQ